MFSGKNRISHDFTTDGVAGSYLVASDSDTTQESRTNLPDKLQVSRTSSNYEKPLEYIKKNPLKDKEDARFSIQNEQRRGSLKNDLSSVAAIRFSSCIDTADNSTRRERMASLDGLPCRNSLQDDPEQRVKRTTSLKKRLSLKFIDIQNAFEKFGPSKEQKAKDDLKDDLKEEATESKDQCEASAPSLPNGKEDVGQTGGESTHDNFDSGGAELQKDKSETELEDTLASLQGDSSLLDEVLLETSDLDLSASIANMIKEEQSKTDVANEQRMEEIFKKCIIQNKE